MMEAALDSHWGKSWDLREVNYHKWVLYQQTNLDFLLSTEIWIYIDI